MRQVREPFLHTLQACFHCKLNLPCRGWTKAAVFRSMNVYIFSWHPALLFLAGISCERLEQVFGGLSLVDSFRVQLKSRSDANFRTIEVNFCDCYVIVLNNYWIFAAHVLVRFITDSLRKIEFRLLCSELCNGIDFVDKLIDALWRRRLDWTSIGWDYSRVVY